MANGRIVKQIDHLSKIALELHDYIINVSNSPSLGKIMQDAKKEYDNAWFFLKPVYYFSRSRDEDFNLTIKRIQEAKDPIEVLGAFLYFLDKGNWESTSANVLVMQKLLSLQPNYKAEDANKFFTPEIHNRLSELFIEKAKFTIQDYQKMETERLLKVEKQKEVKPNQNTIVKSTQLTLLKQLNDVNRFKKMNPAPTKKLTENEEYVKNGSKVEKLLQSRKKTSVTPVNKINHYNDDQSLERSLRLNSFIIKHKNKIEEKVKEEKEALQRATIV